MKSTESDRLKNTRLALNYAMDCAISRIGPSDLQECFGEIATLVGGDLDNLTIQMLDRIRHHVQDEFVSICDEAIFQKLDSQDQINNFDTDTVILDNISQKYEDEIQFLNAHVSEENTEHERLMAQHNSIQTSLQERLQFLQKIESELKQASDDLNP